VNGNNCRPVNSSVKTSIRLLLDQGIPRDAAAILRHNGDDCVHVGEIGMTKAEDDQILAWARHRFCMVVTVDADFRRIESPASEIGGPKILRINPRGPTGRHLDGPNAAEIIHRAVSRRSNTPAEQWPLRWPSPSTFNSTAGPEDESFFRLTGPHGRVGYAPFYCPEGFNFVRPHARQLFVLAVQEYVPEVSEALWETFERFGIFEPLTMTAELENFRRSTDMVIPHGRSFAELRQKVSGRLESPMASAAVEDWARRFNLVRRGEPVDWIIRLAQLHIELHVANRMYGVAIDTDEPGLEDYERQLQQAQHCKKSLPLVPGFDQMDGPPWWMEQSDLRPPIDPVECEIRLPPLRWDPFQDRRSRSEMRETLLRWRDAEFEKFVDAELERIEQLAKDRGGRPTPQKRRRRGSAVIHFRWAALFQCGKKEVAEIQALEENSPDVPRIKAAINEVLALVGFIPRPGKVGRPRK
jgi:hypothetical protein